MKLLIPIRYLPNKLTKKDKARQAYRLKKSRKMYKKGIFYKRPSVSSFTPFLISNAHFETRFINSSS